MNLECLMKKSKLVCAGEGLAQNDFKARIWEEDPDGTKGKHHTDTIIKPVRKFKSTDAINAWVIQINSPLQIWTHYFSYIFNCVKKNLNLKKSFQYLGHYMRRVHVYFKEKNYCFLDKCNSMKIWPQESLLVKNSCIFERREITEDLLTEILCKFKEEIKSSPEKSVWCFISVRVSRVSYASKVNCEI